MWLLFVVAAGMSAAGGLQRPPLDAMLPRLVPREELAAASALDGFRGNAGQIAGPALAGVLIATVGLGATYAVDAASFLVSLGALARMRAVPAAGRGGAAEPRAGPRGLALRALAPGADGSYAVDINAMLFGIPIALFPAVADRYGGPELLGLLYAAGPVGAALFTLRQRLGRAGAPPRPGDRAQRRLLRRRDRRLRPRRRAPARARRARRGRRGGHVVGDLPPDAVEPDDPGPHARPAGRDRAALLLDRPDARHGALRRGRVGHERAVLDRGRRRRLRGRDVVLCALLPRFWRYEARDPVSA